MKLTNKCNLPNPIVSALSNDTYKAVGDISVTTLINPPQIRVLRSQHEDEIVEDVSDRIWLLLGSAIHSIIERMDTENDLQEERLVENVNGTALSGMPDLYTMEGVIWDFKVTSVWTHVFGGRDDWENQLNCYAWLMRQNGFDVNALKICMILRDWTQRGAERNSDFPDSAVVVKEIPLWNEKEQLKYIQDRVLLHTQAMISGSPPECSPKERWAKDDSFAVKKPGNKRATKVFDNMNDAARFAAEKGMIVDVRIGESVRCERYCPVKDFCPQYREMSCEKT